MANKIILFVASAIFFEIVSSQCHREPFMGPGALSPFGQARGFEGFGAFDSTPFGSGRFTPFEGMPPMMSPSGLAASCGGGLSVTSSSPITPTGLTVDSQNAIEGPVIISGQMPFLGTVATDSVFSTAGVGAVTYGCGDGTIGITAETPINLASPMSPNLGYGLPFNGSPNRPGLGRSGIY